MATIEHRDGQEIKHRQVHIEDRRETEQIVESQTRLLTGDLRDQNRPAQFLGRHLAAHKLHHVLNNEPGPEPGLSGSELNRFTQGHRLQLRGWRYPDRVLLRVSTPY